MVVTSYLSWFSLAALVAVFHPCRVMVCCYLPRAILLYPEIACEVSGLRAVGVRRGGNTANAIGRRHPKCTLRQKFPHLPNVIRNPRSHRWRHAQRPMNPAEVVIGNGHIPEQRLARFRCRFSWQSGQRKRSPVTVHGEPLARKLHRLSQVIVLTCCASLTMN